MNEPVIYLTYPDGWVRISAPYLVRRMPMYDLDIIIAECFQRCDDELLKLDAFVTVFEVLQKDALDGYIEQRRFWRILKRFKRLGFAPGWNEDTVIKWFEHIKEVNNHVIRKKV